ncbi:hypothetical protein I3760_03G027200 [Carya illinoinensis]|nr:hypothetical protein I3760_03G027200 [Carya illinoinensis]
MPHQRSEPTGSRRSLQMHAMERSRFKASRGFSPMRNFGELRQVPSLRVEEPLTVAGLLQSLGLGKYNVHFRAEEVDMTALRQMGDTDLKEMRIPMGPRIFLLSCPNPDNPHNCNVKASFGYID